MSGALFNAVVFRCLALVTGGKGSRFALLSSGGFSGGVIISLPAWKTLKQPPANALGSLGVLHTHVVQYNRIIYVYKSNCYSTLTLTHAKPF